MAISFFERIQRILSPYVLLIVNLLIIFLAETIGHGTFFYDTGLIHGIAALFILLAGIRTFQTYYVFDPELRILLKASLFAQGFFAVSHVVEFASMMIFHSYMDVAFANVANFYIISLICFLIGTEYVLERYANKPHRLSKSLGIVAVTFLALTILFLARPGLISLETETAAPYMYAAAIIGIGIYSSIRLKKIARMYPLLAPFVTYLIQATALIVLAALPNIFYDILNSLGMEEHQIIYVSHFTFYGALSLMFLAYGDSLTIGGLHADIREQLKSGELDVS